MYVDADSRDHIAMIFTDALKQSFCLFYSGNSLMIGSHAVKFAALRNGIGYF